MNLLMAFGKFLNNRKFYLDAAILENEVQEKITRKRKEGARVLK